MATVNDICAAMAQWADPATQCSWDNSGLQIGRKNAAVTKVLTALDATEAVIGEAIRKGCEMIVVHHPMIFSPMKSITEANRDGMRILTLAENRIAVYSAHTNMDKAFGGTNDMIAQLLGLQDVRILEEDPDGILRLGYLEKETTLREFAALVKERLGLQELRSSKADPEKKVRAVAICTGGGSSEIDLAARSEADVYVTGDLTYHKADYAGYLGLPVLDAGHYGTENQIAGKIAEYLNGAVEGIRAEVAESMEESFLVW